LKWFERLLGQPLPGDEGIVECLVYFKAKGHQVCLVTDDQLLRQRVDAQGVASAGLRAWQQYIKDRQLWF
jgi:rRNA-processing protein FCF1